MKLKRAKEGKKIPPTPGFEPQERWIFFP